MSAAAYSPSYQLPAGILALAVHGAFFALLYFGFTWQATPPAVMNVTLWQSLPNERVMSERVTPPVAPVLVTTPPVLPVPLKTPVIMTKSEISLPFTKQQAKGIEIPPTTLISSKKEEITTVKTAIPKPSELTAEELQAARDQVEQSVQAAENLRLIEEYSGKINGKIKRNIVMPPDVPNNARAEFSVTLLPGGSVLNARLIQSSGNLAYDTAVERAILKSNPLPIPSDVKLFNRFRELKLGFQPKE